VAIVITGFILSLMVQTVIFKIADFAVSFHDFSITDVIVYELPGLENVLTRSSNRKFFTFPKQYTEVISDAQQTVQMKKKSNKHAMCYCTCIQLNAPMSIKLSVIFNRRLTVSRTAST